MGFLATLASLASLASLAQASPCTSAEFATGGSALLVEGDSRVGGVTPQPSPR